MPNSLKANQIIQNFNGISLIENIKINIIWNTQNEEQNVRCDSSMNKTFKTHTWLKCTLFLYRSTHLNIWVGIDFQKWRTHSLHQLTVLWNSTELSVSSKTMYIFLNTYWEVCYRIKVYQWPIHLMVAVLKLTAT